MSFHPAVYTLTKVRTFIPLVAKVGLTSARTHYESITPELVDLAAQMTGNTDKLAAIGSGGSVIAEIIAAIGQFLSSAAGQALIAALIQLLLSSATPQPEFAAEPHYEIMAPEVSKPADDDEPEPDSDVVDVTAALRVYVVAALRVYVAIKYLASLDLARDLLGDSA